MMRDPQDIFAHGDMEYRRAASGIVVNPDGKLLLLIGSEWKERPDRSHAPDLPGGTVETNETIEIGFMREVKEETGLEVVPDSLFLAYQHTDKARYEPGFWRNNYFLARSTSDSVVLSFEHEDFAWLHPDEFIKQQLRPSQRRFVDFVYNHSVLRAYLGDDAKVS
jgi:8-oxo-dGTP pyrophosphatase MutT (NUDIX family)